MPVLRKSNRAALTLAVRRRAPEALLRLACGHGHLDNAMELISIVGGQEVDVHAKDGSRSEGGLRLSFGHRHLGTFCGTPACHLAKGVDHCAFCDKCGHLSATKHAARVIEQWWASPWLRGCVVATCKQETYLSRPGPRPSTPGAPSP